MHQLVSPANLRAAIERPHWHVDSAAAVAFTTRTFDAMKRYPRVEPAEALRRWMQALVAAAASLSWAPFVVVGEGPHIRGRHRAERWLVPPSVVACRCELAGSLRDNRLPFAAGSRC
jgi:hypothetical protein